MINEEYKESKVLIIIPYYRNPEALARCMECLKQSTFKKWEVFVHDNSEDNIYFTAAINEGLRAGMKEPSYSHFLVLNQDCYLEPNALEMLISHSAAYPNCGIVCPIQLDDGQKVTWGGSLQAFPLGLHLKLPYSSYDEPFETYWANGACMLVKRGLVTEIGLFDKNCRFFCSDADYSFTARSRGWGVHVVPIARVEHSLHGSTDKANEEVNIIKIQDVIYFYEKWISGDLYMRISHEGPTMDRVEVNKWVLGLKADLVLNGYPERA